MGKEEERIGMREMRKGKYRLDGGLREIKEEVEKNGRGREESHSGGEGNEVANSQIRSNNNEICEFMNP